MWSRAILTIFYWWNFLLGVGGISQLIICLKMMKANMHTVEIRIQPTNTLENIFKFYQNYIALGSLKTCIFKILHRGWAFHSKRRKTFWMGCFSRFGGHGEPRYQFIVALISLSCLKNEDNRKLRNAIEDLFLVLYMALLLDMKQAARYTVLEKGLLVCLIIIFVNVV